MTSIQKCFKLSFSPKYVYGTRHTSPCFFSLVNLDFDLEIRRDYEKKFYERRIYESVDDGSLS